MLKQSVLTLFLVSIVSAGTTPSQTEIDACQPNQKLVTVDQTPVAASVWTCEDCATDFERSATDSKICVAKSDENNDNAGDNDDNAGDNNDNAGSNDNPETQAPDNKDRAAILASCNADDKITETAGATENDPTTYACTACGEGKTRKSDDDKDCEAKSGDENNADKTDNPEVTEATPKKPAFSEMTDEVKEKHYKACSELCTNGGSDPTKWTSGKTTSPIGDNDYGCTCDPNCQQKSCTKSSAFRFGFTSVVAFSPILAYLMK